MTVGFWRSGGDFSDVRGEKEGKISSGEEEMQETWLRFSPFFADVKKVSCDLHKKNGGDSGESHRLCKVY